MQNQGFNLPNQGQPQFNMQLLQQQQAAALATAGGRAPSPASGLQPPPVAPGATQPCITVPTVKGLVSISLNPAFVAQKHQFIAQHMGNLANHPLIFNEYQKWSAEQQWLAANSGARPAAGAAPAAKRVKVEPGVAAAAAAAAAPGAIRPGPVPLMQHQAALAALAGARPPLPPGMLPGMGLPPVTAAQASAAAQLRLQQGLVAQRAQFPPIFTPSNVDERQYVPKPRLQALVKQVGLSMALSNARPTEDAEAALRSVAEDFVSGMVSFAVSMARRRKSQEIEPADLRLYLERTWSIQVPGFSKGDVKPYQRQPASAEHQRRMAAVRKAMAASTAAAAPQPPPAAAGAGGTPAAAAAAAVPLAEGGGGGAEPGAAAAAATAAASGPPEAQQAAAGEGGGGEGQAGADGDDMPDAA